MNKKYKLTDKKFFPGINKELWQIEALCDFGDVKKGERGGWIEKEVNLDAKVYGDAWVYGNAKVYGDAEVCGDAKVYGDAEVYGNAKVYGDAWVYGDAEVCGNADVYGNAKVCGNADVYGDAAVCGNAKILVLGKLGNSRRFITATWSKDNCVKVRAGCFFGTIDDFQKAVTEKYGDGESDYMLIIPLLRKKEKEWGEAQQ